MTSQTPEEREIEEVVEDFVKGMWYVTGESQYPEGAEKKSYHQGFSDAVAMAYIELTGTPKSKGLIDKLLLSQQQKHRETWLREEIVKLKKDQEDSRESCRGSYKIIVLTKEMEGFIDALQIIIDRYQAELEGVLDNK